MIDDPAHLGVADGRHALLARLARERAGLLALLLGLDEETLTGPPLTGDWTVKDTLAHMAAWDRWEYREMGCMLRGDAPDLAAVRNVDEFNAAVVAEWRHRRLAEVIEELRDARAVWVGWLRTLPEAEIMCPRLFHGEDWSFRGCLEAQWQHDAEHGGRIADWREARVLEGRIGPKEVLLAALDAAREELLAASLLIRDQDRTSRPVCGDPSGPVEPWTLKDVLGHLADWEWLGVQGLRQMAAGREPDVELVEDLQEWNQAHWRARRHQPWETVWADLRAARQALGEILQVMSPADLARPFPASWDPNGTPYSWACVYVAHDREHARDLHQTAGA